MSAKLHYHLRDFLNLCGIHKNEIQKVIDDMGSISHMLIANILLCSNHKEARRFAFVFGSVPRTKDIQYQTAIDKLYQNGHKLAAKEMEERWDKHWIDIQECQRLVNKETKMENNYNYKDHSHFSKYKCFSGEVRKLSIDWQILRDSGIAFESDTPSGTKWSEQEFSATLEVYRQMLVKERHGESYTKADYNKKLRDQELYRRSHKSIEDRFMNISYVLQKMGIDHIKGYKPRRGIAKLGIELIIRLITNDNKWMAILEEPTSDKGTVEKRASFLPRTKTRTPPAGQPKPKKIQSTSSAYSRDLRVVAYVLREANGECEMCLETGPFIGERGKPYLTVHHVVSLSDGGPDTVCNTVAVCPNCHEGFHHAEDSDERTDKLYEQVKRLKKPPAND